MTIETTIPARAGRLLLAALVAALVVTGVQAPASAAEPPPTFESSLGSLGSGPSQFNLPWAAAVTDDGGFLVTDEENDRVRKFTADGVPDQSFGVDGGLAGTFDVPGGIAIDSRGVIYVSEFGNDRLRSFNPDGTLRSTIAEGPGTGTTQLNDPATVTVDRDDNVYVADRANHRVQKYSSAGVYERSFGLGRGSGPGQLFGPSSVAVDLEGTVHVADTNNSRVQTFSPSGALVRSFGTRGAAQGQFNEPYGIEVDRLGDIYVADTFNHRVQKFTTTGSFLWQVGTKGSAPGQFDAPVDVAVDEEDGSFLVADYYNHRVQRFRQGFSRFTVAVSGTPRVGEELTADVSAIKPVPASLDYQWLADGEEIAAATSKTFTPGPAQGDTDVAVRVTAKGADGRPADKSVTSDAVLIEPVFSDFSVTIVGTPAVGRTLTAEPSAISPTPASYAYQWFSGGQPIAGETSRTFTPGALYTNQPVSVRVTAQGTDGRPADKSATSAAVTLRATAASAPVCDVRGPVPAGYRPLEGTSGQDTLRGTSGRDLIRGYGGNDTISGAGEDDILCGGDGNDRLLGEDGADVIFGGTGNDTLSGGAGDDLSFDGAGNDLHEGGAGTDTAEDTLGSNTFRTVESVNPALTR